MANTPRAWPSSDQSRPIPEGAARTLSPVANFPLAVRWLAAIFRDAEGAAREFLRVDQGSALALFLRLHLPLLWIYPVAAFLCPAVHLPGFGRFSFFPQVVAPLALVLAVLALATLYDQIARFAGHPQMEGEPGERTVKNLALFLHLPLSGAGFFFFLHPLAGFLMLLVALVYCLWNSIETTATMYAISRARAIVHLINAVLLGVIPLAALALLGNILRNFKILENAF